MDKDYEAFSRIEEIDIEDDLVKAKRRFRTFPFPAVSYADNEHLIFNMFAAEHLKADHVEISVSSDYVVLLPAKEGSVNSFKVTACNRGGSKMIRVPIELKARKLAPGVRRLYKYKDGVCFKRFMTVDKAGVEHEI